MLDRVKSFFGFSTPVKSVVKQGDGYFYAFGFPKTVQETITIQGQIAAYNVCAPVNGIINRKARAFSNARWWVMDKDGKEVNGQVPNAIRAILRKPNPLQSWNQLMIQAKVYEQVFGEAFLFAITPEGFRDKSKVKAIWVIPNWMINVKLTGKHLLQTDIKDIIEGYELSVGGERILLDRDSIIHLRDANQNNQDVLLGQSRLASLQDPVSNIVAAYEARNTLITRKGALGILSNQTRDAAGSVPLKQGEKEEVQNDFQKYGLSKEQWQVIITNSNLRWQSMTFPTKELMLFEEIEDDVRQIADNYDYPMYLLGFKAGSTFSNVGEAKKSLYQDTIIPEAEGWADTLTSFFGLPEGVKISIYYDHLDIFQQSEKDKADAFKVKNEGFKVAYELGIVTKEEWRVGIDYDPVKFNGNTFHDGQVQN
ncbi:MAG: hypothetical protein CVU66_00725 [Deltaproteobacteria bacterium HGW-Deltaproteobacteria-23]|nr:MAG: hypothetical protein CVU66_00725 [Deltaproteobacteria bacterium HGW-Deltaproteobacteria-23]